jgi:hypothetical protein
MNLNPFAKLSLLTIALLLGIAISQDPVRAQSDKDSDWQMLRPDGEEFTILMPKEPKTEESQEPYHKMTLNTRLYLSATEKGPVFAVMSLSGIKSNPALYTEFQRLNSYVDAFKTFFPAKVRGKDAVAKLTLVGDKTLNGNAGREYKVVIGDLSGTAQTFATRKRFYAVVVLNTKKDDALSGRFLSSFYLPERTAQVSTDVAAAPDAAAPGTPRNPSEAPTNPTGTPANPPGAPNAVVVGQPKPEGAPTPEGEPKPGEATPAPTPKPGERAPISGGVLNGKALYLPKPEYPPEARAAGVSGTVNVQVTIDESGNVMNARVVSGPPSLHAVCMYAALAARFSQTTLMGEPVKVTGIIIYNFVR